MIEMTLAAFKLGMGDEVWIKNGVFPQKNTSVFSLKNSAKRDTRPLRGMFNSPIYVQVEGGCKKEQGGKLALAPVWGICSAGQNEVNNRYCQGVLFSFIQKNCIIFSKKI